MCDSNFPLFLGHSFPSTSRQHTNRKAGPFVFLVCCAEGFELQNMEGNMQTNPKLAMSCPVHRYSLSPGLGTMHAYPLKLRYATSEYQASPSMRLIRKQLRCTFPFLFLLWSVLYFICCRSLFHGQFTPKIHNETKQLQGKLQWSKLVGKCKACHLFQQQNSA